MKKSFILLIAILILSPIITAQEKVTIELTNNQILKSGEALGIKITVYDANNNPLDTEVQISIEDAEKRRKIEKTIRTNKLEQIDLGESATHGFWAITAKYNNIEAKQTFSIEAEELAKFELQGDTLTITNIGNTRYSRTIQIQIGGTSGIKEPKLNVGESVKYRLIAPEGTYNVQITDGKTTLSRSNVILTGNVIGILDEQVSERAGLTGGIKPSDEDSDLSYEYLKRSKFTYVFILAIFGAMVFLAIERRYSSRLKKK